MDIEEKLKAEQRKKLKRLQETLADVLNYEPADSGNEDEDAIWQRANNLKDMLDDFFQA